MSDLDNYKIARKAGRLGLEELGRMKGFRNFGPYEESPESQTKNLGQEVELTPSEFEDVGTLGDVESRFGIKPFDVEEYQRRIGETYRPARQRLGSGLASARSAAASRLGGRSATPEHAFAPIESQYFNDMSGLEGGQAEAELGAIDKGRQQDLISGSFLQDILARKDAYRMGKFGLRRGVNADLLKLEESKSTPLEDLLAVGGTVAKFVKPL